MRPIRKVVVGGDVCIDWLSVPVSPAVDRGREPNWRLRGGEHMFAVRGGAWLTADLLEAAAPEGIQIIKPAPRDPLASIPPDEIIHSMIRLRPAARSPKNDSKVWRIASYMGYAGSWDGESVPAPIGLGQPVEPPELMLLDDAGNGYRDHAASWSSLLAQPGVSPLVVYKGRRPLMKGALWDTLRARHAERTIVVLTADELRASGALISRELSWEKSAYEAWLSLAVQPSFAELRACAGIVITFGLEGVLVMGTRGGRLDAARLWFAPRQIEGDSEQACDGTMAGFGSAFAAGLAAHLLEHTDADSVELSTLSSAARRGLRCARRLLEDAFGPVRVEIEPKVFRRRAPAYPNDDRARWIMQDAPASDDSPLVECLVARLSADLSPNKVEEDRAWQILHMRRVRSMQELAEETLCRGIEHAFPDVPAGVFSKLVTLDRTEMEGLRSIQNLMLEYIRLPNPERPLCLAVFGQPGSGKSFGVKQVAQSVAQSLRGTAIEPIEFNLTQWGSPACLVEALHRVRDLVLRKKAPLVFFDEFDASPGGAPLGWLKSFLAPMQDGLFSDGHFDYQIGRAIFVFAGGTSHSFHAFAEKSRALPPEVKATDFLSRLRGHVNVLGFDQPVGTNMVRRAVVLRVALMKQFPGLFDAGGTLRIDRDVARAFLTVSGYRHGARSIEAIVDMSRLVGCSQFHPACLPPHPQLEQHVDAAAFEGILLRDYSIGEHLEAIARRLHEAYVESRLGVGVPPNSRPALRAWDQLSEFYRNSNREQAAHIPLKLDAVGCDIRVGAPEAADGAPIEAFAAEQVERLAQLEHARWMEERNLSEPEHPDLKPWDVLDEAIREIDRAAVRAIPAILRACNLWIVPKR